MTRFPRRIGPLVAIAAATVLITTGCSGGGTAGSSGSGGGSASSAKVAFLMPDQASTRYEQQDSPLFKARMKQLCPDCQVLYQNAAGDPSKQQQQADSVMTQGVKAIVLDAVDTKAAASIVQKAQAQQIKVITYDRPITNKAADFYVSFDNEGIGKLIAQSLVEKVKKDGGSSVLEVNGSPTDDAAKLIKKGVHEVLDTSGLKLLAEYDTPEWDPQKAQDWTSGQITRFRNSIDGVVAANDGTASGAIAAFKAAGREPVPPVTGNDAEIAAVQRIVAGDQYNTISKPIKIVAGAAADATWALLNGQKPKKTTTLFDTPSQLFTPQVVTQDNVKKVIFDGGVYTPAQVCTGDYAAACSKLGIQ